MGSAGAEFEADSSSVHRFSARGLCADALKYELRKARRALHSEGLTKAIDALDFIVTLIRNSRSVDEAGSG